MNPLFQSISFTHPAAAMYLWVYVGESPRTNRILAHLDLAHWRWGLMVAVAAHGVSAGQST